MDSITQFTLGAVIGQIIGGRRYGIKAGIIGGVLGTIPDLDVFIGPLLYDDAFQVSIFHRSYTHSIFFQTLASFLFAGILQRLFPRLSYRKRYLTVWLCFITHSLIDLGTSYGLPIWIPFSRKGVSTHHISIIDPLYTMPLLIGLVGAWLGSKRPRGRHILYRGTGVATIYFVMTIATKIAVHQTFEDHLPNGAISHLETPELANTILRKIIAEDTDHYYLTRYNIIYDDPSTLKRYSIPKNNHLRPNHPTIESLYERRPLTVAHEIDGMVIFHTLGMNPIGMEQGMLQNQNMFGWVRDQDSQSLSPYADTAPDFSLLDTYPKRLQSSQAEFLDSLQ